MRIGLATSAFQDLSLVDAVDMCIRYSDHVHLSPIYSKVTKDELEELQELKECLGADYSVHAPFPNHNKWCDLSTESGSKYLMDSVKNARALEADRMVIHCSSGPKDKVIRNSKALVKMCEDHGMTACFENSARAGVNLRTKEDFLAFVKEVPGAKFCFDTSHYFMWDQDLDSLVGTVEEISPYIGIVHMVDTFPGQDAHMLPGFGEIALQYLVPSFMKIPDFKDTPFILEDQEPYEYDKGILNLRHGFVGKKGYMDRRKPRKKRKPI